MLQQLRNFLRYESGCDDAAAAKGSNFAGEHMRAIMSSPFVNFVRRLVGADGEATRETVARETAERQVSAIVTTTVAAAVRNAEVMAGAAWVEAEAAQAAAEAQEAAEAQAADVAAVAQMVDALVEAAVEAGLAQAEQGLLCSLAPVAPSLSPDPPSPDPPVRSAALVSARKRPQASARVQLAGLLRGFALQARGAAQWLQLTKQAQRLSSVTPPTQAQSPQEGPVLVLSHVEHLAPAPTVLIPLLQLGSVVRTVDDPAHSQILLTRRERDVLVFEKFQQAERFRHDKDVRVFEAFEKAERHRHRVMERRRCPRAWLPTRQSMKRCRKPCRQPWVAKVPSLFSSPLSFPLRRSAPPGSRATKASQDPGK